MLEAGLDATDAAERLRYGGIVLDNFRSEMTAYVRQFSDDCTVFYNRGHVGPHNRRNVEPSRIGSWSRCPAGIGDTSISR